MVLFTGANDANMFQSGLITVMLLVEHSTQPYLLLGALNRFISSAGTSALKV